MKRILLSILMLVLINHNCQSQTYNLIKVDCNITLVNTSTGRTWYSYDLYQAVINYDPISDVQKFILADNLRTNTWSKVQIANFTTIPIIVDSFYSWKTQCINLHKGSSSIDTASNSWKLIGNDISSTDFLGTNNSQPLVLKTSGTEKARITTAGKVGINTNAPTSTLDINGDLRIRGLVTSTTDSVLGIDDSGYIYKVAGGGSNLQLYSENSDGTINQITGGLNSIAMLGGTSDGEMSVAIGRNSGATNIYDVAIGKEASASGGSSIAIGDGPIAQGAYSTAIGNNTTAIGLGSVSLGVNNSSNGDYSFAEGFNSVANGAGSIAIGYEDSSSSDGAIAIGATNMARGITSVAIGNSCIAYNICGVAIGYQNIANGGSFASGNNTFASGNNSTAMGFHTIAKSYNETAIGSYNTDYTPSDSQSFSSEFDRQFVVGNGVDVSNRSDAFTILKNAQIGMDIDSFETTTNTSKLQVNGLIASTIQTISADITLDKSNTSTYNLIDNSGGAINITLPSPGSLFFKDMTARITFKLSTNNTVNTVTILPSAAEQIDKSPSFVFTSNYESVDLVTDGTNWWIVSNNN